MGKKQDLQKAEKELEVLVKHTNTKIVELGKYDYSLYVALVNIQERFDRIRNTPTEKQLEYQNIKKVSSTWKEQVDIITKDYESAKNVDKNIAKAGTTLGVGVATLGPTAAMGFATTFGVASTGTAISALSGAAASNAALAWLGGGALSAGGGGMLAGKAMLAMAGPVGWAIAGVSLLLSAILFWKAKNKKDKLYDIFLQVNKKDQYSYQLAIVELNERIKKIKEKTIMLNEAVQEIVTFGTDYRAMTESQQMKLGTYVNLMRASTQLLVSPIMGLLPKFTEEDFDKFVRNNKDYSDSYLEKVKNFVLYMANFLYEIETDNSGKEVLCSHFRNKKMKNFREGMNLEKDDINLNLFYLVDEILKFKYNH